MMSVYELLLHDFFNYQIYKFKVKEIHNSSYLFQMYWFQIKYIFVRIEYVSLQFSCLLYIFDFKFYHLS